MDKLHQANTALAKLQAAVNNQFYPRYHLAAPAGWLNDPNGLCWHEGLYHAFYQHHPFDAHWGPMHWGHATSTDMLHWQHQPIALAPSAAYDQDGCFSGSAISHQGVLYLFYTGHVIEQHHPQLLIRQAQCLATSDDGIHFTKHGIIIPAPEGYRDFRDPKVWREDDSWWMLVGARDAQGCGQVFLYQSTNLRQWQFIRVLLQSTPEQHIYMLECPDMAVFAKDKRAILCSPQGMQADGYRYRNLFQSGYYFAHSRLDQDFTHAEPFVELDYGHDFYAPQSFIAEDGRKIIMAWFDMWEANMPSQAHNWAGCMTLPRELKLNQQGIYMQPIRELQSLRQQKNIIEAGWLDNQQRLLCTNAQQLELTLSFKLPALLPEKFGFWLGSGLEFALDGQANLLKLSRHYPEYGISDYRAAPLPAGEQLDLQVFIDQSSIEVFINQGQQCFSSRIYPAAEQRQLTLFSLSGKVQLLAGCYWPLTL